MLSKNAACAACSRLTMSIMFVGAVLLTGAYGSTDSQFLAVFLFSLAFYGKWGTLVCGKWGACMCGDCGWG